MRTLILFVVTTAFSAGCSSAPGVEREFGKRPDWSLTGPDGAKARAIDFDGKVVILDFWATWCAPCRRELSGFVELQEKYREKGLAIVGLSLDRDKDTHDRFVRENHLNYPSFFVGSDEGRAEVIKFEQLIGPVEGFPTTLIIRRDGSIVYKHVGFAPPEEFERILRTLL